MDYSIEVSFKFKDSKLIDKESKKFNSDDKNLYKTVLERILK